MWPYRSKLGTLGKDGSTPPPHTHIHWGPRAGAMVCWRRSTYGIELKPCGKPTVALWNSALMVCRCGSIRRAVEPCSLSIIRNSSSGTHARTHTHARAPPSLHIASARFHHTFMPHRKKTRLSTLAQPLPVSQRSPHCPPTPPAHKHKRPKAASPPSPAAPVPQGLEEMGAVDIVPQRLFISRHSNANTAVP